MVSFRRPSDKVMFLLKACVILCEIDLISQRGKKAFKFVVFENNGTFHEQVYLVKKIKSSLVTISNP